MKQYKNKIISVFSYVMVSLILMPALASAATQSYDAASDKIQPGMLVSLTANAGVIESANDKNGDLLLGVASTEGADLNQQPGQVGVETDGKATALVSTLGGDIKVGDRIAPSSITGVGSKAKSSGWVVGIAQASLDAKTAGAVESSVTDSKGNKQKVYIARIPVIVKVAYYNAAQSEAAAASQKSDLQAVADKLAGKHASIVSLVLSFLLVVTGIFFAGQIITSTIKNAFAAIARQPLSKTAIFRLAFKTFALALLIVVAVCAGAFLLLRIL